MKFHHTNPKKAKRGSGKGKIVSDTYSRRDRSNLMIDRREKRYFGFSRN